MEKDFDVDKYFYWEKNENVKLSNNFYSVEFDCKCHNDDCKDMKISKELIEKLQWVRNVCGKSINVTSGFRCKKHQESLRKKGVETAVGVSSHELGWAADVHSPSVITAELIAIIDKVFNNVGVAINWAHVDVRPLKSDGSKRRWKYS